MRVRFVYQTISCLVLATASPMARAQSYRIGTVGGAADIPSFKLTDLGLLTGGAVSQATAISDAGVVTGYSGTGFYIMSSDGQALIASGTSRGFIYSGGVITEMSTPVPIIVPLGVNDYGEVVGVAGEPNQQTPRFVYQNGEYQQLSPAQSTELAYFFGINDAGQVVGVGDLTPGVELPFIWQAGTVTQLPIPGHSGWARGISSNGEMAAGENFTASASGPDAYVLPVVWTVGTNTTAWLPALPSGFDNGRASAINNRGEAAGLVFHAGGPGVPYLAKLTAVPPISAAYFFDGKTTLIPSLPGAIASLATSINHDGWVVGYGINDASDYIGSEYVLLFGGAVAPAKPDRHAFLWLRGTTYDLTSLVIGAPGWQLTSALGINESGQIVGAGLIDGEQHAFLLTPRIPIRRNAETGPERAWADHASIRKTTGTR